MDFDAVIYVRELSGPDDVTLLTDGDEAVAKVQAPRVEEVAIPAETTAEEGAETEAGEAGPEASAASDEG